MRNILLIGNGDEGSYQIRGIQTSNAIKKYCSVDNFYILKNQFLKDINNIKNSIIIFVGEPLSLCGGENNLILLKKHNNILIYDIIDNFCFEHTNVLYNNYLLRVYEHIDILMHPNSFSEIETRNILPYCKHVSMPHPWDMRNEDIILPELINIDKAAYIGTVNGGLQLDIDNIKDIVDVYNSPQDVNTHHVKYNIQVSFREKNNLNYLYKPCTKLAMASSFGAILLTSNEPAITDIVGESYTFYINSEEELRYKMNMIKNMSSEEIRHYRQNALIIKDYLSPKSNAKRYIKLIKDYLNEK
jgi:hypothetical protein